MTKRHSCQNVKMTVRDLIQDSAAGASLSSTASALETYRDHFKKQFVNPHTILQQTILDFGGIRWCARC